MKSISLSQKEIVVLASVFGTSEVYGIPDVFKDYPKDKLLNEVNTVRDELVDKGILDFSFSKGFCIKEEVKELLLPLFLCEKFISIDRRINGKNSGFILYTYDEKILFSKYEDGFCSMSDYELDNNNLICDTFIPLDDIKQEKINANITFDEIKSFQSIQSPSSKLVKRGITANVINLLKKTFAGVSNYYSYSFVIPKKERNGFRNIMIIDDVDGKLKLNISTTKDYADSVCVVSASNKELIKEITDSIIWIKGEKACQQ